MKWFKTLRPLALITLAGGIISQSQASAAVVADPVNGDIFLGIRATSGQGADSSILIDLGQDSIYRNLLGSGASISISIGDIGSDLTALYGSGWSSRTDLSWSIFGVRSSASSSVYASEERLQPALATTAWAALDLNGRNSTGSQISSVIDGTNGYRGRDATANSAVAVIQPNAATASSYAYQVGSSGTTDFGSLSQWGSIEGTVGNPSGSVLDFYRLSGSATEPVQLLGSFSLSPSGALTFTAVPEPSGLALSLASAGLLLRRRRSVSTL